MKYVLFLCLKNESRGSEIPLQSKRGWGLISLNGSTLCQNLFVSAKASYCDNLTRRNIFFNLNIKNHQILELYTENGMISKWNDMSSSEVKFFLHSIPVSMLFSTNFPMQCIYFDVCELIKSKNIFFLFCIDCNNKLFENESKRDSSRHLKRIWRNQRKNQHFE